MASNLVLVMVHCSIFPKISIRCGSRALGELLWRGGDVAIIDGAAVNGSARLVGWLAGVARGLQSGYLYHYAFATIIGLSALLAWLLWRS